MTATSGVVASPAGGDVRFYSQEATSVVVAMGSDASSGLAGTEAATRLAEHGPYQITSEKPPSVGAVALAQLRDPMNIMLLAVAVVSLAIGEVSTALLVAGLVVLNVGLGTRQELTARAPAPLDAAETVNPSRALAVAG
jgi:Ca2+-transporting ATPase